MNYAEVAPLFLTPTDAPVPEPVVPDTPARRLRDATEAIATQGWWSPAAGERMTALGLPFLGGYVWGRAAAIGSAEPGVVCAAFGVFEPNLLTAVYTAVRNAVPRDVVLESREQGGTAGVAAVVSDEEADAIATPLLRAVGTVDEMGRTLFGALRSLPVPESGAGRLWRAAELVREHRGDGHLAALATAGLDACEANVLTELWLGFGVGEYSGTRGFSAEAIASAVARLSDRGWVADGVLTPEGRAARDAVEAATDRSQAHLVAALGDDLEPVIRGAADVSARLLAARSAPADPRKRAGG